MKTNKEMRVFLLIAFGVPAVLGIFMWIARQNGLDVNAFPITWMFLPAAAAMAAKKRSETPEHPFPKALLWTYLAATGLMVLLSVASAFAESRMWAAGVNAVVVVGGVVCLAEILAMGKEKRSAAGLSFGKNIGKSLLGVLLFVGLYVLILALQVLFTMWIKGVSREEISQTIAFDPNGFITLMINLSVSYLAFFGEEYGWRYFLQPALQRKFGLKKGVLLLGVLWGLWHLPLNFLYYSPQTGFFSLLTQVVACIGMGVFMGWLYGKTGNIWSVVLVHFLNNNIGFFLLGTSAEGVVLDIRDVLIYAIVYMAVFLPFLLTKEYRQNRSELMNA